MMEVASKRCGAGSSVMVTWVATVRNEVTRFSRSRLGSEGGRGCAYDVRSPDISLIRRKEGGRGAGG
jgi:hypothetical protein